jgi:hypothetical protein
MNVKYSSLPSGGPYMSNNLRLFLYSIHLKKDIKSVLATTCLVLLLYSDSLLCVVCLHLFLSLGGVQRREDSGRGVQVSPNGRHLRTGRARP